MSFQRKTLVYISERKNMQTGELINVLIQLYSIKFGDNSRPRDTQFDKCWCQLADRVKYCTCFWRHGNSRLRRLVAVQAKALVQTQP